MLSESVLFADQHPFVEVKSIKISRSLPHPEFITQFIIRGQTKEYTIPVEINIDQNTLIATGELKLKQTDFGIEPYGILLGSVKVKDIIQLKFKITAKSSSD